MDMPIFIFKSDILVLPDDSVDVTSEPLEQDISAAASHLPNKRPQLEVQLGGAVTLQCPQGQYIRSLYIQIIKISIPSIST